MRDRRARGPHPPRRAPSLGALIERTPGPARARRARAACRERARPTKYVFVTGGVVSALGKGIVAASLGRLLKARGLRVQAQKFDPYLNVDPGTMSPFQHGEVFVTEDGAETDLDIGHYERFIDENLSRNASHTRRRDLGHGPAQGAQGRVPRRDRAGDPAHHERDQGADPPRRARPTPADVVISEIGGTVGDIESLPFLEAIRQFRREVGPENVLYLHVTLVPVHRGGGRAEDEADAALRQRAAPHRYPPRHRRLPLARGALRRHPREDRALRRRRRARGRSRARTCRDVYLVPRRPAGAGPRRARLREARARRRRAPSSASGTTLDRPDRRARARRSRSRSSAST